MARYHINPETGRPNICRAKTPDACKYAKGGETVPHYDTKEDARAGYEKEMASELLPVTSHSTKKRTPVTQEIHDNIRALFDRGIPRDGNDLEYVAFIGHQVDAEVFSRAGVKEKESYSAEELDKLARASSEVLYEIQGDASPVRLEVLGPHGSKLREAVKVLPPGIMSAAPKRIYTKNLHRNYRGTLGTHIACHDSYELSEETIEAHMHLLPKNLREGDVVSLNHGSSDFNELLSARVHKVVRTQRELRDGDKIGSQALSANIYKRNQVAAELLEKEYVDHNFRVQQGMSEKIKEEYPEVYKRFQQSIQVSPMMINRERARIPGEKDSNGRIQTKYKKVASSTTVRFPDGTEKRIEAHVFQAHDLNRDFSSSTISVPKGIAESEIGNAVLLHEFGHSVETKVTGQNELYREIKNLGGNFPAPYQADSSRSEVWTVALEGIFYPNHNVSGENNDFMYSTKNSNAQKVRKWALGNIAMLSMSR